VRRLQAIAILQLLLATLLSNLIGQEAGFLKKFHTSPWSSAMSLFESVHCWEEEQTHFSMLKKFLVNNALS
jgi:hypothetical protein